MARDFTLYSLDVETGGLDPTAHALLSMGLVDIASGTSLYRELAASEPIVTPGAMAVNGLDLSNWGQVRLPFHLSKSSVEEDLLEFLSPSKGLLVFCGLNVSFDVAFIKNNFPLLSQKVGFRHLDLNSILLAGAYQSSVGFIAAKAQYSSRAEEKLGEWLAEGRTSNGIRLRKHNALYDAFFNCFLLAELVKTPLAWTGVPRD